MKPYMKPLDEAKALLQKLDAIPEERWQRLSAEDMKSICKIMRQIIDLLLLENY